MRLPIIALFLAIVVVPAYGQTGSIGIFADAAGTNCNLPDVTQGMVSYYLVHVQTSGATASQFYAPQPACLNGIYLATTCIWPIGPCDAQTGIAQGYGSCVSGSTTVAIVNYFVYGLTPPCCYYPVLPSPQTPSGRIEVVDCAGNLLYATGGTGIVNATPECMCDVPAAPSTWGRVKVLYTN